jgi:hypothetical protein
MKSLFFSFFILATIMVGAAQAGNCTYPDDRASDGSRCGGRASTIRPGGR